MPSTRPSRFCAGLRRISMRTLASLGLFAAFAVPAVADEAADVAKLLRGGQFAEAVTKADAFLATRPRDAQMRFLKGVALTEQNKSAEAIAVFIKLTEDFPELPEPYNNLAVLYAAAGQYDKARAALDMAIRTNPSYATAYENLGDVHAKLASQAYDKALQLDSGNSTAKSKLTLLRGLAGTTVAAAAKPTPAVAAAKPAAAQPAAKPAAAATQVAAAEPHKAEPKPAPEPMQEAKPKPPAADTERDEVLSAVHNWAKAWSAKDVNGYLGYYAADFKTPKGEPRKAWAAERQTRIAGKGRINVKVDAPRVTVNGDSATVVFRQIYESDQLKADSRKTLLLAKQGGKWLIKQERTGS